MARAPILSSVIENINDIILINRYIPGCPPSPQAILEGILKITVRI
ncbi:MAG: hypothetical protein KAH05_02180 [Clostridiales bacterium]|nr:hypothetical protein [Clostridiales bacterium]